MLVCSVKRGSRVRKKERTGSILAVIPPSRVDIQLRMKRGRKRVNGQECMTDRLIIYIGNEGRKQNA